jgi:hypothetical protein
MFDPDLQAFRVTFFPNRVIFFFIIYVYICILNSCDDNRETIIFQKTKERVDDYREERLEAYRSQLLADAEKIVDSLLLTEAAQSLLDSLNRSRPGRPVQPPDVPAIDTAPVRPLFAQPKTASSTRN